MTVNACILLHKTMEKNEYRVSVASLSFARLTTKYLSFY